MDADSGDMRGAGWSNGSSPGFNGSAAFLSAGNSIRGTSLASCNSPASWSSSDDFEIGSNKIWIKKPCCNRDGCCDYCNQGPNWSQCKREVCVSKFGLPKRNRASDTLRRL